MSRVPATTRRPSPAVGLLLAAGGALLIGGPDHAAGQVRGDSAADTSRQAEETAVDAEVRRRTAEILFRRGRRAAGRAVMEVDDVEARRAATEEVERLARAGLSVAPEDPEGRHLLALSYALRIMTVGIRDKITLAVAAHREARAILEEHPDHAGAHHIVGRLHAEAMAMSWFERFAAARLGLGELADEASWESARRHLARAAELEPGNPKHRLELAKLHLKRDRPAEAAELLGTVAAGEAADPLEAHHRREARALLEELRAEEGR